MEVSAAMRIQRASKGQTFECFPEFFPFIQAAGLATMIAAMRPDIDNVDEYVRNTTARAFSVVASALGIPALLPFLKAVCSSKKSWQARHTGIKIVQQISILMGCAVLPHLKASLLPASTFDFLLLVLILKTFVIPHCWQCFRIRFSARRCQSILHKWLKMFQGKGCSFVSKAFSVVLPCNVDGREVIEWQRHGLLCTW